MGGPGWVTLDGCPGWGGPGVLVPGGAALGGWPWYGTQASAETPSLGVFLHFWKRHGGGAALCSLWTPQGLAPKKLSVNACWI